MGTIDYRTNVNNVGVLPNNMNSGQTQGSSRISPETQSPIEHTPEQSPQHLMPLSHFALPAHSLASMPEALNQIGLGALQYQQTQRADFYATAGVLLHAAQQQQHQQHHNQQKTYDGQPLPDMYQYPYHNH
jgi:hypothetical protein